MNFSAFCLEGQNQYSNGRFRNKGLLDMRPVIERGTLINAVERQTLFGIATDGAGLTRHYTIPPDEAAFGIFVVA